MPRVVHFEIHAENPERAIAFYTNVFGWQFQKWGGEMDYWLITTGNDPEPGINGGLIRRRGPSPLEGQPVNAYACTIQVPAIDVYLGKVTAAGGVVVVPKMPIPGVGWLFHFKDTEGNIVGVHEHNPQAG